MGDYDYDFDLEGMYDEEILQGASHVWYDDEFGGVDEYSVNRGFWEELDMCVLPTLWDGISQISTLLLWCLIFRVTTQTGEYARYLLKYAVCELCYVSEVEWHKIRGAQMIVAMKVISVSFDVDIGTIQKVPSPVEFAGYVLNVGTCIFGPWIQYNDYIAIYDRPLWNLRWIQRILMNLLFAMVFLSISTCWSLWLIPDDAWRWWGAYRDALSFRSSHYFVSYVSEVSAVVIGLGRNGDNDWSVSVTKPLLIEFPRSLGQVVVNWNKPMHHWLKTYVFKKAEPHGTFFAVLSTYAASSLLHGLNFQLSAVLLSLGVYSYTEYKLREKLATIFRACIRVKPCRAPCSHQNGESCLTVRFTNFALGLLVVFHLAYLGLMFDSSSKEQEVGYSYSHTLSKWESLSYASHWVVLGSYVFYRLI